MSSVYASEPNGTIMRTTQTPSPFHGLGISSSMCRTLQAPETQPYSWGDQTAPSRALALAVLGDALGEDRSASWTARQVQTTTAWQLHRAFCRAVIARLPRSEPFRLAWIEVQRWLDARLRPPRPVSAAYEEVRAFEECLMQAVSERPADALSGAEGNAPWLTWDLCLLFESLAARQRYPLERLPKFFDYLQDLKFYFYCLLEVDWNAARVAANAARERRPAEAELGGHALLATLSFDATAAIKSRLIWERVMNAVYYLETGVDLETKVSGKRSKKKVFFDWVTTQPQWASLRSFEEVVQQHDDLLRTPEVHKSSRLRAVFLHPGRRDPDMIFRLINPVFQACWDHIVHAAVMGNIVDYDVTLVGAGIRIDATPFVRVRRHAGQTFKTSRGGPFTYTATPTGIRVDGKRLSISSHRINDAITSMHRGLHDQDIRGRGATYVRGLLSDQRISGRGSPTE